MIHIRVPRPLFVFALLSVLVAGTVRAESLLPEMFLPAEAGKVVILADSSGMKRSFFCIKRDKNKVLIEEVICCFQPASKEDPPVEINMPGYKLLPTPKEPWSTKEQYTLSVNGTRLVSEAHFGGITLLDLAGGSWTVPIFSSPGMPKTETCKAVSWQSGPYFGKERTIVTVECNACLDGERVHTETWTLATGIGFVGMTDFKLSSIETTP